MLKIGIYQLIMAALAALGIIAAGGREVKAGVTPVSSLSITGGIVQVSGGSTPTDPYYTYQFQVYLNDPGTVSMPTSFTIDNLAGISPISGTPPPFISTTFSSDVAGGAAWGTSLSPGSISGTTDVTWTYYGGGFTPFGSAPYLLGNFGILSDYPIAVMPTTSTTYTTTLDGVSSGPTQIGFTLEGGLGTLAIGAPEPSSAIAPLMVLLGLPVVMLLKRRRARRGLQAA